MHTFAWLPTPRPLLVWAKLLDCEGGSRRVFPYDDTAAAAALASVAAAAAAVSSADCSWTTSVPATMPHHSEFEIIRPRPVADRREAEREQGNWKTMLFVWSSKANEYWCRFCVVCFTFFAISSLYTSGKDIEFSEPCVSNLSPPPPAGGACAIRAPSV